jgi:hypothetical protein
LRPNELQRRQIPLDVISRSIPWLARGLLKSLQHQNRTSTASPPSPIGNGVLKPSQNVQSFTETHNMPAQSFEPLEHDRSAADVHCHATGNRGAPISAGHRASAPLCKQRLRPAIRLDRSLSRAKPGSNMTAFAQWRHDGLSVWALLHNTPLPPTIASTMYWFIVLLK